MILSSDLDEIPNPEILEAVDGGFLMILTSRSSKDDISTLSITLKLIYGLELEHVLVSI